MLPFSIFILAIFGQTYPSSLLKDPLLKNHFTNDEIVQLDSIRTFFNQQVTGNCQHSDDIATCYRQYFDRLANPDNLNFKVPYQEQLELYKTLDTMLIQAIWRHIPYKSSKLDTLVESSSLDYDVRGKYIGFLSNVAKDEPYFGKYLDPIKAAGHSPPSLAKGFMYDSSGLDFSKERHQLILAIH